VNEISRVRQDRNVASSLPIKTIQERDLSGIWDDIRQGRMAGGWGIEVSHRVEKLRNLNTGRTWARYGGTSRWVEVLS
jgi:hypothetical protein